MLSYLAALSLTLSAALVLTHPFYGRFTEEHLRRQSDRSSRRNIMLNLIPPLISLFGVFQGEHTQWAGLRIRRPCVLFRSSHLFLFFFLPSSVNPNVEFRSHEEGGAIHHPAAVPSTALSWRYLGQKLIIQENSAVAGALI